MARAFNFTMQDVLGPVENIPGAAGQAQQPVVITPPGFGSYQNPWATAADQMATNFQNQAAQGRAQKQQQEAVKGIGEFWPTLKALGVTEGQVNSLLKSGMSPEDINKFALSHEAERTSTLFNKGLDWKHEDWTHQRNLSEKSYNADQMDVVQDYADGKLSLSDAMRKSSLTSTQLRSATEELSQGMSLQAKPAETAKKNLDYKKEALELQDLPDKLKQEGQLRVSRMQQLEQNMKNSDNKEAREQAKFDLDKSKFEYQQWKESHKTTKGLNPENQQVSNSLRGLGSSQAMYAQAKKQGLDVRPPTKAAKDELGFATGKEETKDSYFRDVVLPALSNKQMQQAPPGPQGSAPYKFPSSPYGRVAPQVAQSLGIDPNIFGRLIKQESGWNPGAVSPKGAMGLGQFMPGTAKQFGYTDAQLKADPMLQIGLAASYFKQKLNEFGGDYAKALAAYNAGSGAVHQYNGIPPYKETQQYVQAILGPGYNQQPVAQPGQQQQSRQQQPLNQINFGVGQ